MYQLLINLTVILLSLSIGSFLNVCIYRIPRGESINFPPSHCPACGHRLGIRDLFPILSYILLKFKCGYCGVKISKMYPLLEALTATLLLILFFNYGLSYIFFEYLFITSALIVVAVIDIQTMTIKDSVVFFIAAGVFLFKLGHGFIMYSEDMFFINLLVEPLFGFLVGGGLFLLIAILSKGAMGGGDIKLMAVLGLWCGYKDILLISVLSFWISAAISLVLIALKKKNRKDYIPFAPFIGLASYVFMIFGSHIYSFYKLY